MTRVIWNQVLVLCSRDLHRALHVFDNVFRFSCSRARGGSIRCEEGVALVVLVDVR